MVLHKKIILPLAAVAVIGAGAAGVTVASAASSPNTNSLAGRIASAFGLDQSKVQTVINQYRSDQSAKNQANFNQRLSTAVTNGKITAAQQSAILAERTKLDGEVQAAMQKTGADRRAALKAVRTEAQTWAQQNNLAVGWLLGGRPVRGAHRFGPMASPAPATSPSPAPSS